LLYFSSVTVLRPPPSTLFPYTTLFRSRPRLAAVLRAVQGAVVGADIEQADLHRGLGECRRRAALGARDVLGDHLARLAAVPRARSEEHTSELQSRVDLVCRLLLEKKKY